MLYKEEFEKNKGKGFSAVADTPEMQRIKKTQDQISNVSYQTGKELQYYLIYIYIIKTLFIHCFIKLRNI